jgi:hypothetical protein
LKPQRTSQTTTFSEYKQAWDAAFQMISRLLTETLAENKGQVTIRIAAGNIFHSPLTSIHSTTPLRVSITQAYLKESGTRTEIRVSGLVENQDTIERSYTLYFVMKRHIAVIPSKIITTENIIGRSLVIHLNKSSANLHDSLFHLSLNHVNSHGKDYILGEGRGFLLFDHHESITDY